MDYNSLIEQTKQKLDNYSFDDSAFNDLYTKAQTALNDAYKLEKGVLDSNYRAGKLQATGENALKTKSLSEELATRGLARSGESAMLRINQGISLNNALNTLANSKLAADAQLGVKHNNAIAELEMDFADKKNAAMESDKAALQSRLQHLENLNAQQNEWQAKLYASMQLAEKEAAAKAEEQKRKDEEKKQEEAESNKKEEGDGTLIPTVSAATMAKNIVRRYSTNDGYLSAQDQNQIYAEFARLISTSNLNTEYAENVLAALRSHGFKHRFNIELAASKHVNTAYNLYSKTWGDMYYGMLKEGAKPTDASGAAKAEAEATVHAYLDKIKLNKSDYNQVLLMLGLD